MELERAEAIVREILAPKYLSPPQELVFRAAWNGRSYQDLAADLGYEYNYIKGIGAQIWKMLATATECRVSKGNFRQVLATFADRLDPLPGNDLTSTQPQIDWGEAMDVSAFYGRERERSQLYRWLVTDRCRVVAILGMGGMGKTTIAIELVQQLQAAIHQPPQADRDPVNGGDGTMPPAQHFSYILWRSLLNAPPLRELLPELIRAAIGSRGWKSSPAISVPKDPLSDRQLSTQSIPTTVKGQIELLLTICQQYRCLLVLDNAESIFQAGAQVGQYREGYADYGDLFSTFGRMNHQSCLIITSREKPIEIGRLEGIDAKVRTLVLPGLDAVAGQQIFVDRGCKPVAPAEWAEIDRYCGGNPLAFQLIAAAVQDVADGDVSEIFPYLRSSNLGFADIHILIEQQWERLTISEQQVMYWLAIGREPLPIADLEAALHPTWNRHDRRDLQREGQVEHNLSLLSVLQSLRRRSIISTVAGQIASGKRHWSLQPMVMEYATGRFVDRLCTEIGGGDSALVDRQQPLLLDTHPIVQANAKEYIRQAQLRTIVRPTIERLRTSIGNPQQIGAHLRQMLAQWQRSNSQQPGYLAGNLLNFLTDLKLDLSNLDCAELVIQQAYLVGIDLTRVNFSNARLVDCAFTQTFSKVLSIAYSPDGETLAASDSNGEIRLWHVRDGQCSLTCSGHANWVRSIKFSPDGRYLASSSDDLSIKLWDLQDGACVQTLGDGIHSMGLSFSPDGRYLASGSANNRIYIWDLQTGTCARELTGHQDWSIDVRFSPQGDRLVSGGADGTLRVWDVASGDCLQVWQGHKNWVTTVDYSPDGEIILSGSLDGTLRLWDATEVTDRMSVDMRECQLVVTEHGQEIWSAVFSPDGSQFASAGMGGTAKIWCTSDGDCLHQLVGHSDDRLWSIAFHPHGHYLASGGEDRTIRFWQTSDGKCWQALNGYTNWFRSIAWSHDGKRLITASRDAQIRVWSMQQETSIHSLCGHHQSTLAVAADPHGRTFASGSDDRTIRIWDADTLACMQVLRGHTAGIMALVYSPDGKYLVSGGSDLKIRIWDAHTWRCLEVRTGHTDRIGGLAYHPDRDLFASAGEDRTVRIWSLHDPTPVHILSQHTNRAVAVAFDPGGRMLASGGIDRQIQLWRVDTGEFSHTLTGHEGWILSLAYSPDGQWLFSGASDYSIRMWSMATGLCHNTLVGHQSWVWSISVSPCGRFLASASEDETIRIWDLADGSVVSTRRAARPYEGMRITGVDGLTKAQIDVLKVLGAQE